MMEKLETSIHPLDLLTDLLTLPLQEHQEIYRYRNINVPGQLQKPNYNTIKYGRNSLKVTSILTYNHTKKEFPETDFISLRRIEFKNLITRHYLGQYKNQT